MPKKRTLRFSTCMRLFGMVVVAVLLPTTLLLVRPTALKAQGGTGSINGTVRDTSGAVIPNATVDLTNVETGAKRTTLSNDTGNYALVQLPPGRYTLDVGSQGFTPQRVADIVVLVNQTATYDVALKVGPTVQKVTVEASAVTVETSTAELGTVVTTHEVNDLPLNGRNFTELLSLTPGVSPANVSQSNGFMANPIGDFTFPSVNGQTNRSNFYLLDGINNQNDYASAYAVAPVVDAIQEFKVQSHNDEAQYGGALGGIINVVTKSGTNSLHGSAWEFLRNSALDARNPLFPNVTSFRQNQFGATIGGPVVVPHYNGRNKTFFFGDYQGFRSTLAATSLYTVPTPAELSGDLSDTPVQIYNPFSTRPDPSAPGSLLRDPFMCDAAGAPLPATNGIQAAGRPCNKIPATMLDPGMQAYAKALFPAPVATSVPGINGVNTFPNTTRQDEWSARVDENLNDRNSLWFRYSGFNQPVAMAAGYAGVVEDQTTDGKNWGASWLHMFGPSATMQLSFGHNNVVLVQTTGWPSPAGPSGLISQVGFAQNFACSFQFGPYKCMLPGISITGFLSGGPGYFESPATDVWEAKGDFSFVKRRHTFKFGFDINKMAFNGHLGKGAIDTYENEAFASFETSNLETSSGGSALASFLLGVPDNASLRGTWTTEYGGWVEGFYFQDQIKITNKLTANIGGRYDFTLRPLQGSKADAGNIYIGDLDLNNGTYILQAQPPSCAQTNKAPCIPGGVLPPHVVVTPFKNNAIYHNSYDNIQPRIGLAYRLNDKTALRGSFGMFYDNWAAQMQSSQNYTGTWPSVVQSLGQNLNPGLPTATAEDPLKLGSTIPLPDPTPFTQTQWYQDPLWQNPYSEQWNLGVERQVTGNTLLALNYVGSHSSRLDIGPMSNVAVTPGPGNPQDRAPYRYISPTFYDKSIGRSSYNALQFQLKKSYSQGFSYLISYTWSKAMDIGCSGWYGVEGCSVENPYNLDNDRSVAGFDLTHVLSASWVYELPIGRGRKFSTGSRVADYVVGNWQLNGILTFTSGLPYDVGASGDIANTGMAGCCTYGYERLNPVGNPTPANQSPSNWLNKSAFVAPPPYTFGTLGRNALRADWFKNGDLSIFRQFPFTESKRLEFRFEMFNFTNTPTWGIPDQTFSDPTFGQVLTTRSIERQLQFALKLYF
jgi:Carboxypeptidase regulatory-like domain/TonB-dependent Receptor Plug Domain/TonB dependent receptor